MLSPEQIAVLFQILSQAPEAGDQSLLLQRGAALTLILEGIPDSLNALRICFQPGRDPLLRDFLLDALVSRAKTSPAAVDFLYLLALEDQFLPAVQAIEVNSLVPSDPALMAMYTLLQHPDRSFDLQTLTDALLNRASAGLAERLILTAAQNPHHQDWAELAKILLSSESTGLTVVTAKYLGWGIVGRSLAVSELSRRSAAGDMIAQEVLCDLFLEHDSIEALQACLELGISPSAPERRAVFFFLSSREDRYLQTDPDYLLLIAAFESSSRSLRRRILEAARRSGRVAWLAQIGRSADLRLLSDLSESDWQHTLKRFAAMQELDHLWKLAQIAPPIWSAAALRLLDERHFSPPSPQDRETYRKFLSLAQHCRQDEFSPLPARTLHLGEQDSFCMAVSADGTHLAVGGMGATLSLWNLVENRPVMPSPGFPSPVVRSLLFANDSDTLVAACGDQRIRIVRISTSQVIKSLEGHHGMIRSLALSPDQRTLVSSGFDGQIRAWRLSTGTLVAKATSSVKEIFTVATGGSWVASAGASPTLFLWQLSDLRSIVEIDSPAQSITHLAAGGRGEFLAAAGRPGYLAVWNPRTTRLIRQYPNLISPITGLAFHPTDSYFACAAESEIWLHSPTSDSALVQLSGHSSPITALVFSDSGDRLYSLDQSGRVCLWDIRLQLWLRNAYTQSSPPPIEALRASLSGLSPDHPLHPWLQFTLALWEWSRRFDILLASDFILPAGDFDIQL